MGGRLGAPSLPSLPPLRSPPPLFPPLLPWGKRGSGDSPPLPRFGRWLVNFCFHFSPSSSECININKRVYFGLLQLTLRRETVHPKYRHLNAPARHTTHAHTDTSHTQARRGHHPPTIRPTQPPHVAHAPPRPHRPRDESYPLHHKLKVTPLIIHHFFPTGGVSWPRILIIIEVLRREAREKINEPWVAGP